MKIAIIGAGYVGLVTGVSLASLGHKVICIDSDLDKVSTINKGAAPFYEKGLNNLLKKLLKRGMFLATDQFEKAVSGSEITIIAVGTPTVNNKIDLSAIKKVSEEIGKTLQMINRYHIVAVKSTVLPGVSEDVVKKTIERYSNKKAGNSFGLCMNPEFLREGSALEDALNPDRIIIGQLDQKSGKEFAKIYKKIPALKFFTNLHTAEMIKYASNGLFATLISYANEIARISEKLEGVDVVDVWKGVHLDRRLSPIYEKKRIKPGFLNYISSGCGFGGSCLPKDTKALASFSSQLGVEASIIKSVIEVNNTQPERAVSQLKKGLGKNLKNKRIAVLGLSFKPNTDDVRESPAFPIIERLLLEGVEVTCHDPMITSMLKQLANLKVVIASTVKEAIKKVDGVVIVTAWDEYAKLSPKFFMQNMKYPLVVDTRRIYDKSSFLRAGVIYKGVGL